jgi:class 3 adenylate cyclase
VSNAITILFADISGSTALYDTLGNEIAQRVIGQSLTHLATVTQNCGGHTIKTIGDEIMASFPNANLACRAACEMQQQLSQYFDTGGIDAGLRVGFNHGSVIAKGRDVFGDAVNVAARMVQLAKADQVITTQATVELLETSWQQRTRSLERAAVRGKREEIEISEIIWRNEGLTVAQFYRKQSGSAPSRLKLEWRGQVREIDREHPKVTLGRENNNDVVVNSEVVSRQHAYIELRRDKFFLVDRSTNGTFAFVQADDPIHLRREELLLQASGFVSLGQLSDAEHPDAIRFSFV